MQKVQYHLFRLYLLIWSQLVIFHSRYSTLSQDCTPLMGPWRRISMSNEVCLTLTDLNRLNSQSFLWLNIKTVTLMFQFTVSRILVFTFNLSLIYRPRTNTHYPPLLSNCSSISKMVKYLTGTKAYRANESLCYQYIYYITACRDTH